MPYDSGMPASFDALDDIERDIIKAVFSLMKEQDIPRIRIAEVLKLAGVSRSTFYRRFSSVDAVVKRFEEALLDSMGEINTLALKGRFGPEELDPTATMVTRMEILRDFREQVLALNGPHGDPGFLHKATVLMHNHLRSQLGVRAGDADEVDMYLAFVVAGHHNLIQYWLEERPEIPPEKVAAASNRLFYAPLFLGEPSSHAKPIAAWLD